MTHPTTPTLPDVFETLGTLAATHAEQERIFHGVQAKKALMNEHPGFSESEFGFGRFVDLLRAGQDAGRFALEIVEGHSAATQTFDHHGFGTAAAA